MHIGQDKTLAFNSSVSLERKYLGILSLGLYSSRSICPKRGGGAEGYVFTYISTNDL
jgi:hypothetical protein